MRTPQGVAHLLVAAFAFLNLGVDPAASALLALPATIAYFLDLDVRPLAIGHRGFGANLGEDPTRPIENTVEAVRAAYMAGVSIVEIDVQLTRDHRVVVYHDDFLPDFTCLERLTLAELRERLPHVPTLREVLQEARDFNDRSGLLRGLLLVELKAPAPLCDPHDTRERALVSAVVRDIRRMGMSRQVILTSFSPALLSIACHRAPEIARALAASGLQFLELELIEAELGLPVTRIDKRVDVGLPWAEIGGIFRLPGYVDLDALLATAEAVDARVIEADLSLLSSTGADLPRRAHARGLKVFGFTATTPDEWSLLESLDVDGIYTDDVPFGERSQATIPTAPAVALTGAR
jgi:glycerophosphoryl diester phosphodiesterase